MNRKIQTLTLCAMSLLATMQTRVLSQEASARMFDPQTPVAYPKQPGNILNESRKPLRLPQVNGFEVLKCDFHMHTVFSDGSVWPTTRVEEAFREGLDVMAITEHLEFHHLHAPDVNAKNLNREYEIARQTAERYGILLIPGAEVTREVPAGHFNILFVKDANLLEKFINYDNHYDPSNLTETLEAAKEQGCFIFWNHPSYKHPKGIAEWYDIHESLYQKGLMDGIEVANSNMYIPLVQQWAEEKNLTMFSNSDYHNSVNLPESCYRPMTLVFARERSAEGIREALESRRTIAFAQNYLYGQRQLLEPLFKNSLEAKVLSSNDKQTILQLTNLSGLNFDLEFLENECYAPATRQLILFGEKTIALVLNNKPGALTQGGKLSVRVKNMAPAAGRTLDCTLDFCNGQQTDGEVLKDKQGWNIDSISPGIIRYHYAGYYQPCRSFQNVNVLEVDMNAGENALQLAYIAANDSLSSVAEAYQAQAGINGTYEPDASYVRADGKFYARNELKEGHLRYWKHEGALFMNADGTEISIGFASDSLYNATQYPNILSGAPMLIDNYRPVGLFFTGNVEGLCLDSLEYEDYRRHQGVRHPRTAVAAINPHKILLITVDGRNNQKAAGMSAAELTEFLQHYFRPQAALNIDGGGSTTFWMRGFNESRNSVVNYPTDNKRFDHNGQRRVTSFILVNAAKK